MSLLTEFKAALEKAVNNFSEKEGKLTELQAQAVFDLKHLIESMKSAVHLRQEILLKLPKLPSKMFSFLPFVNELPKVIRRVLEAPQFSENQLLIAGYCDLHTENRQLHEENALLREEFEKFKTSGLAQEVVLTMQNLKQENIRLTDELIRCNEQHQQALQVMVCEKDILEKSVVCLTHEKQSLQIELTQTNIEKQQLAENYLQKVDENTQLKEQNKLLREELESYKKIQHKNDTPQNIGRFRAGSQL